MCLGGLDLRKRVMIEMKAKQWQKTLMKEKWVYRAAEGDLGIHNGHDTRRRSHKSMRNSGEHIQRGWWQ